jgi:hypothetical protein
MTPDDTLERRLAHLPRLTPDEDRAERVKSRCRAQCARGRRRQLRRDAVVEFVSQVLAPAAVGGVCAVYVACLVVLAIELGTFDPRY